MIIIAMMGVQIAAQTAVDTYYSSINTSSASFVSDLQSRIRSPYTQVAYAQFDETNVANYASRDTTGGQRAVTCVYSGYVQVYTPPFAWTPTTFFSREHTWCQSWFPTGGSTTSTEGADQHHLFPVHQNNANGVRSNHPLENVSTVTSSFLEAKYGKNSSNKNVYEPRASHKGDAARALLYMSVRYNGVSGYDWTFNNLNDVILPGQTIPEAPQDVTTLIAWHKQDPPDKWEVERNSYIQSIQGNRNPFIDHPEYVSYINFNDHTKLSPVYSAEPDVDVTSFSAYKHASTVDLSWTNPISGTQLPSGYLIIGYNKDDYFIPIDGETYSDDTDFSDGIIKYNITYSVSTTTETFNHPDAAANYYFRIYSYFGSSTSRNYKISGTISSASGIVLLPVELTSFTGSVENKVLNLKWQTATEVNNYGFEIQKTSPHPSPYQGEGVQIDRDGRGWVTVGFVKGNGNSYSPKVYSFVDKTVSSGKYFYRLKQIDNDGQYTYSKEVEVDLGTPTAFALEQNYPNPFNPTTSMQYSVSSLPNRTVGKQFVTIKVFDMLGREVALLVNGEKEPGTYTTEFATTGLASGTYIYRMQVYPTEGGASEFVQTKKMVILK